MHLVLILTGLVDVLKCRQAQDPYRKLSPTYGWTDDQIRLWEDGPMQNHPKRERKRTKSPMGG